MSELSTEVVADTDSFEENLWNNVAKQSQYGNVFNRTEWLEAIDSALDSEPQHILVKRHNAYLGLLPNFVTDFDLPFSVPSYIEPLVFKRSLSVTPGFGGSGVPTDEDAVVRELIDAAGSVYSGNTISHRVYTPNLQHVRYARYLESGGYTPSVLRCRFVLDIDRSWEAIKSDFGRSRRRNLKRGEDYDYEVRHTPLDQANIPAFYSTYRQNMERTNGRVFPQSFFHELADRMPDRIELFTFAKDGESLGYHMVIRDDLRNLLIDFFFAVDEEGYEYYPHEVLTKHIVNWARDEGFERYSLSSTRSHYDNGVFKFKSQFGGDMWPLLSWERGYGRGRWSLFNPPVWQGGTDE